MKKLVIHLPDGLFELFGIAYNLRGYQAWREMLDKEEAIKLIGDDDGVVLYHMKEKIYVPLYREKLVTYKFIDAFWIVLFIFLCMMPFIIFGQFYFESELFNKHCNGSTTWFDAVYLELRVDGSCAQNGN